MAARSACDALLQRVAAAPSVARPAARPVDAATADPLARPAEPAQPDPAPAAPVHLDPFATLHVAVPLLYYGGVLLLSMCAVQPVLVALSLAAALTCSCALRGTKATLRGLAPQLPLALLITLANPLFTAQGSTLLLRVGPLAVYAESLLYGACMGMLLMAVFTWFACAGVSLGVDRLLGLGDGGLPTVVLMVSMVARLVPQLVRRGGQVVDAQRACQPDSASRGAAPYLRASGVLVGWALEDSLQTADAMLARGWGAAPRRTTYARERWGVRDVVWLVCLGVCLAGVGFLAWVATTQYAFYPTTTRLVAWWGYVPYLVFLLVPLWLELAERRRWR